jgi:hypothetical protein
VMSTEAVLKIAFAVKFSVAGKEVPVKEIVLPERVTPVTVGDYAASCEN